ncbi:unnamed protein product [Urochloa humidicola]
MNIAFEPEKDTSLSALLQITVTNHQATSFPFLLLHSALQLTGSESVFAQGTPVKQSTSYMHN